MKTFQYENYHNLIEKLKLQNLEIKNYNTSYKALSENGYYNIINGYRDPYIEIINGQKKYIPGTSFEQIFSLYNFDQRIQQSIFVAMLQIETHVKVIVSDILAADFGCDPKDYLLSNNFRDRKNKNYKFTRKNILKNLNNTIENHKHDPLKHHMEKHQTAPPWILTKSMYMSDLVNFIKLFKPSQKEKLVKNLLGDRLKQFSMDEMKDFAIDSLFLFYEYRNLCAHNGRAYNYEPKAQIRLLNSPNYRTTHRNLDLLLFCLSMYDIKLPFYELNKDMSELINTYCTSYPNDVSRIELSTGFSITVKEVIYVNEKTKVYHNTPNCCGSSSLKVMDIKLHDVSSYRKCSKCCK